MGKKPVEFRSYGINDKISSFILSRHDTQLLLVAAASILFSSMYMQHSKNRGIITDRRDERTTEKCKTKKKPNTLANLLNNKGTRQTVDFM